MRGVPSSAFLTCGYKLWLQIATSLTPNSE